MEEIASYNEFRGNRITIMKDDYDYEVRINNNVVISTGDYSEAEIVAESLDVCLSILNAQNLLK